MGAEDGDGELALAQRNVVASRGFDATPDDVVEVLSVRQEEGIHDRRFAEPGLAAVEFAEVEGRRVVATAGGEHEHSGEGDEAESTRGGGGWAGRCIPPDPDRAVLRA